MGIEHESPADTKWIETLKNFVRPIGPISWPGKGCGQQTQSWKKWSTNAIARLLIAALSFHSRIYQIRPSDHPGGEDEIRGLS